MLPLGEFFGFTFNITVLSTSCNISSCSISVHLPTPLIPREWAGECSLVEETVQLFQFCGRLHEGCRWIDFDMNSSMLLKDKALVRR